jgi:hypothetical protein
VCFSCLFSLRILQKYPIETTWKATTIPPSHTNPDQSCHKTRWKEWPCRLLSSPSGYPLQILARAEFEAGAIRKPGSGPACGFFATIPHGGCFSPACCGGPKTQSQTVGKREVPTTKKAYTAASDAGLGCVGQSLWLAHRLQWPRRVRLWSPQHR